MRECDLFLIGGGHATLAVLADWIGRAPPPGTRTVLVTPQPFLTYSGVVPGWMAGEYAASAGRVDLAGLARQAGIALVLDSCVALDPEQCSATLASGGTIAFRIAAIDTGGIAPTRQALGTDPRILSLRPIDKFVAALDEWRKANSAGARRIAVIGGGAGGLELAFAARNLAGLAHPCAVHLVTGAGGLLPGFSAKLRRLAARELDRQGIAVTCADARIANGELWAGDTLLEPADLIIAALGSAAPDWPRRSGLDCDAAGFIRVDRHQQSCSHPHILAAGDVASRVDRPVGHSGVHAVRAGPVLAANLRAMLMGEQPARSYRPSRANLYLMNLGTGAALASYGVFAAKGLWAGRLKRWIDTRWIAAYARLVGQ